MIGRCKTLRLPGIKGFRWIFFLIWTGGVTGSFAWNVMHQRQAIFAQARMRAELALQKDIVYRKWAASKGGVYVLASTTAPNPYLKGSDRDIATTQGHYLTLVNPAYMTRQVNEMARKAGFDFGNITSLKPLRPENLPDAWEREALQRFDKGIKEVASLDVVSGRESFRLMIPFVVEASCLKCHESQGYALGEIRGGISSSIDMQPLFTLERTIQQRLLIAHIGIWLLGIGGIAFAVNRLSANMEQVRISEQRAMEERDRAQSYLNIVAEIIVSLDACGNITLLNDSGHRLLGYEPGVLIGKNWFDTCIPENTREEEMAEYFATLMRGKDDLSSYENPVLVNGGAVRMISWRNALLRGDAGECTGLLSSGIDITERARAEVALLDSEERYAMILAAVNDGFWDWDVPSGMAFFSPLYYSLLGYDNEEFPATYASWRLLVHPDDIDRVERDLSQSIETGKGFSIDLRMRMKSGEWRWVCTRGKTVAWDQRNKVRRMVGTLTDITERKQAEEYLGALSCERELLLREVHHRIKNNMSMIASLLSLQASRVSDPSSAFALNDSRGRVISMAVIYDLLYKTSDFRYVPVREYLGRIVDGITASLPSIPGVAVEKRIDDFVMDSKILFPIGIIINELVTNAFKYAFPDDRSGMIAIAVARLPENRVEITVRDDGVGIPDSVMSNGHTGFGMELVALLVKQIRGSFECVREGGTVFRIGFQYVAGEGNDDVLNGE